MANKLENLGDEVYVSRIKVYGLGETQSVEVRWRVHTVHRTWGLQLAIEIPDQTLDLETRDELTGDLLTVTVDVVGPEIRVVTDFEGSECELTLAPTSIEIDAEEGTSPRCVINF